MPLLGSQKSMLVELLSESTLNSWLVMQSFSRQASELESLVTSAAAVVWKCSALAVPTIPVPPAAPATPTDGRYGISTTLPEELRSSMNSWASAAASRSKVWPTWTSSVPSPSS